MNTICCIFYATIKNLLIAYQDRNLVEWISQEFGLGLASGLSLRQEIKFRKTWRQVGWIKKEKGVFTKAPLGRSLKESS